MPTLHTLTTAEGRDADFPVSIDNVGDSGLIVIVAYGFALVPESIALTYGGVSPSTVFEAPEGLSNSFTNTAIYWWADPPTGSNSLAFANAGNIRRRIYAIPTSNAGGLRFGQRVERIGSSDTTISEDVTSDTGEIVLSATAVDNAVTFSVGSGNTLLSQDDIVLDSLVAGVLSAEGQSPSRSVEWTRSNNEGQNWYAIYAVLESGVAITTYERAENRIYNWLLRPGESVTRSTAPLSLILLSEIRADEVDEIEEANGYPEGGFEIAYGAPTNGNGVNTTAVSFSALTDNIEAVGSAVVSANGLALFVDDWNETRTITPNDEISIGASVVEMSILRNGS